MIDNDDARAGGDDAAFDEDHVPRGDYEESFEVEDDVDEATPHPDIAAEEHLAEPAGGAERRSPGHAEADDAGDMGSAHDDHGGAQGDVDWDSELHAPRIAAELRRIEQEIRTVLESRDPKRKRKFAGTRRWLELEEDILQLRYTGRIDEDTLKHIQLLVVRRHHLFCRLRFLASTRPVWNS